MWGHKGQGREVLPHSSRGQPGLPGKVMAGVGRTIGAVAIYFCLGFFGQLPAPWSGVWVQERGLGQGRSGQKVWEGVPVEDGKDSFGVLVSYEDLFLFQLREWGGSTPTAFAKQRVIMGRHLGVLGSIWTGRVKRKLMGIKSLGSSE